ncbi:MAG: hypothetical protein DMG61_10995 [Acidobacteria bacterium]|nr:MAG: hypothetical protein DMG61_10995 [Acidobacteriota bacterium]PYY18528.1 MAG: hypothetical protein DMG60_08080 [Acidobacteriota bacterium]
MAWLGASFIIEYLFLKLSSLARFFFARGSAFPAVNKQQIPYSALAILESPANRYGIGDNSP